MYSIPGLNQPSSLILMMHVTRLDSLHGGMRQSLHQHALGIQGTLREATAAESEAGNEGADCEGVGVLVEVSKRDAPSTI